MLNPVILVKSGGLIYQPSNTLRGNFGLLKYAGLRKASSSGSVSRSLADNVIKSKGTTSATHREFLLNPRTGIILPTPTAGYIQGFFNRTNSDGAHTLNFLLGVTNETPSEFSGWVIGLNGFYGGSGYNFAYMGRWISGSYQGETALTNSGMNPGTWFRARVDGDRVRVYVSPTETDLNTRSPIIDVTLPYSGSLIGGVGLMFGHPSGGSESFISNVTIS